jgi:hypothetical protein
MCNNSLERELAWLLNSYLLKNPVLYWKSSYLTIEKSLMRKRGLLIQIDSIKARLKNKRKCPDWPPF